jgi:Holliday junction resolvase-like predicted endonuclease
MGMSPREQGDWGEFSAMQWLAEQGAKVYVPLGHSPDVDMIADFGDRIVRVQVKTSNYFRSGRYGVSICTRGGNQSWSGLVKRFAAAQCDYLFVCAGDGRRWWIPSDRVEGGTGILLGGPKYAEFEVEPGRPLPLAQAA